MIVHESDIKYTKIIESKGKEDEFENEEFSVDVDENTFYLSKTYCEEELINCMYTDYFLRDEL